ncbi:MAG: NUDIX hydrolase [Acidimicrobiales bacterium]
MSGTEPVRAAGGVVWRPVDGDEVEVLLVHRPRYDDWTLPKGKAKPGESDEDCARREVEEETGLRCHLEDHLADVGYEDRNGRAKVVRYWSMRPVSGVFVAGPEVDEVRWQPIPEATRSLSYERDARVLQAFVANRSGQPGRP